MKNYFNIKCELESCESKIIDEGTVKAVKLEVNDSISIEKIKKEKINLIVKRAIKFTPLANAYVNMAYSVSLETNEEIEKAQLIKDLKEGIMILGNVYSRISLITAQITNESMFGAVITPPMYDGTQIEITDNCK